jgi:general nucleoside transport system permease protein
MVKTFKINWLMPLLAPFLALVLTALCGGIIFSLLGYKGFQVVYQLFISPFANPIGYADLLVKTAPLLIIALGLSLGFQANIWNIGAEGQFILGGIFATFIAIETEKMTGGWIFPLMLCAGILGGMLWAAVPAFLKTRFQVSEILSSLMLTYVAIQLLYYMVRVPFKDPDGYNFPQSILFTKSQRPLLLYENLHLGVAFAFVLALILWLVMKKSLFGFQVRLAGLAPRAAHFAGFNATHATWQVLLIGGGLAGLAGAFEAAGPFGQLVPQFPNNYGYTAIIVAFLGRLHPIGIVFSALIMAATIVGGELAQTHSGLPQAAAAVFQALLLFMLLAIEALKGRFFP